MVSVVAVVAKYKEDISWVDELKCPTTIYDKSKDVPNVGREAETYLQFILEHYDRLPDHVVFLQGKPFDHLSIGTIAFVNESVDRRDSSVQFLGGVYAEGANVHGLRTTASFQALFSSEPPDTFMFSGGAQYIVPKQNILCRPKSFYETIREVMIEFDGGGLNGCLVCPWTIERMWPYIFDPSIPHKDLVRSNLL